MDFLLVGIISYFLGSIPFGFILTKFFLGKDIRNIGSGNIGATNALRTGNKPIGYATLIFDILIFKSLLKFFGLITSCIGKISKFLSDNSLLNQMWIMDPKKKVSEILKENSLDKEIKVLNFVKYKVGEGV